VTPLLEAMRLTRASRRCDKHLWKHRYPAEQSHQFRLPSRLRFGKHAGQLRPNGGSAHPPTGGYLVRSASLRDCDGKACFGGGQSKDPLQGRRTRLRACVQIEKYDDARPIGRTFEYFT
jgi:hypothetical protein